MDKACHFKTCPSCFKTWLSRDAFLSDPNLTLNGYKPDFKNLEYGMFFFTHNADSCHSTMTLMVEDFRDLYSGAIYRESKAQSDNCPRYCLDEKKLYRCDELCECAFVREITQIIIDKHKQLTIDR